MKTRTWRKCAVAAGALLGAVAGCTEETVQSPAPSYVAPDASVPIDVQRATLTAVVGSTRFVAREHFLASAEMQLSGEPLAEAMGRDLTFYSRDHIPADIYFDRAREAQSSWIDLPGFSTAVESYEYSKQAMNAVGLESGAGTSLVHAPLVNPTGETGAKATALLAARIQRFAAGSNALGRFVFPAGTYPSNTPRGGNLNPLGKGTGAQNPLGWPGIWPTTHVFRSFDPAIAPSSEVDLSCSISSDDDPGLTGLLMCADYECDATSLHLKNRSAQIEPVVSPGADGFRAWKFALWIINYLQVMHDSAEAPVNSVADADLASVGAPGNRLVGNNHDTGPTAPGTYLGSSDIEGFQAQMFIEEIDNAAEDWLMHLGTSDGKTLSGFGTLKDALAYDYDQPLRWFPTAIAVAESDDGSGFPRPAYSLASADSSLFDLVGLVMGMSTIYALTDTSNPDVGGSQATRACFDGDPFAADDPTADGEPTLHDRALGMLRVALVDMDRLHVDPSSGLFVDDVKLNGNVPTRGTTLSTTTAAYGIIGLRTALRSVGSQLRLYSNDTPDTALGPTPLDASPAHPPSGGLLGARMQRLLRTHADLLFDRLTDAGGHAWSGWDVARSARTDDRDLLDAHTAAVRGLFAAYLATGDVRYRERALAVFQRMQAVFYYPDARVYTSTPAPTDSVEYTPLRFALLQSALRDVYELVAARPGGEALEPVLEERIGRLNKLVLNGWDDRNQNRVVDWPGECVNVRAAIPRGGLQMAERTLTGETGSLQDQLKPGQQRIVTWDREHDCVPEIDDAQLPAALAASVTFAIERP